TLSAVAAFADGWENTVAQGGYRAIVSNSRLKHLRNTAASSIAFPERPVQYSPLGLVATMLLAIGPVFAPYDAWNVLATIAVSVFVLFLITLAMIWRRDHAEKAILTSIQQRSLR